MREPWPHPRCTAGIRYGSHPGYGNAPPQRALQYRPSAYPKIRLNAPPMCAHESRMNQVLRAIASAFCLLTLSAAAVCAAGGWDDDYAKALARAKTEKKLVLLDFTGSDWCGWCIRLEKEVFSKSEFKNYAKENLVLVEVDFPQGKRQNAKLKAQNDKLQKEFNVQGYPTLIVLNSEGEKVGQLRYEEGGPKPFVAKLQALQESK